MIQRPPLIAVSVSEPKLNPMFPTAASYEAHFTGKSLTRDASFEFDSCLLNSTEAEKVRIFHQHGFSVVEIPEEWLHKLRYEFAKWQNFAAQSAMKQVLALYPDGREGMNWQSDSFYDKELAARVLKLLYDQMPASVRHIDLKHVLKPEPSDTELLNVLATLKLRGEIDGHEHRESFSGQRRLDSMAKISITSKGIDKVEGKKDGVSSVQNIHLGGLQPRVNINSIDNSSNVVNVSIPSEIDKLVQLSQGHPELERVADEIREGHPDKPLMAEKIGEWVKLAGTTGSLMLKALPHLQHLYHWLES